MTEIIIPNIPKKDNDLQNVISGEVFEMFVQSQKESGNKRGLSDVGAYNLRTSTCEILNHCNPHNAVQNLETTHLVVGYVQSGKTMSFTGVLAMAKDNGYRFAIVLTGVTTNLQNQTAARLERDLSFDDEDDLFRFIENPSKNDVSSLVKTYRLSNKPMIIIPILKHKKYINDIAKLFADDKIREIINNETVLIIDDEADQASLNSFGYKNSKIINSEEEEKQSATYAAILRMRSQLPANSYIQYTATPQANILITTTDLLSPKSHTLLIPGEDYIGGKKFFGQGNDGDLFNGKLIVRIPDEEVYHKTKNALTVMPNSLRSALMMHVWAVILVIKWYHRPGIKQLSMLVHPTEIIEGNKFFESCIKHEINSWSETFTKPQSHEDYVMLLRQFENLFPDALQFYPEGNRPTFTDVSVYLPDIINDSAIYRITGESDDDANNLKWNSHRMNILVGAQKLNRGFTVEKLATTYMPRYSTGISNADTIEQRCRFFGYKKDYIESCRVYLPKDSIRDYVSYVNHEEELRTLLAHCNTLEEYEHCVMITPKLRPTRLNVLPKQLVKTKLVGWLKFEHITVGNMMYNNRVVVTNFIEENMYNAEDFSIPHCYNSTTYNVGEIKKHLKMTIPMTKIFSLLTEYKTGNFTERVKLSTLLRYVHYLEGIGEDTINVIFMSSNKLRDRTLKEDQQGDENQDNDIINFKIPLFQGRSNIEESDDYCGDTNIYSHEHITIQIHHVNLLGLPLSHSKDSETYFLAIHLPEKLEVMYCESVNNNSNIS